MADVEIEEISRDDFQPSGPPRRRTTGGFSFASGVDPGEAGPSNALVRSVLRRRTGGSGAPPATAGPSSGGGGVGGAPSWAYVHIPTPHWAAGAGYDPAGYDPSGPYDDNPFSGGTREGGGGGGGGEYYPPPPQQPWYDDWRREYYSPPPQPQPRFARRHQPAPPPYVYDRSGRRGDEVPGFLREDYGRHGAYYDDDDDDGDEDRFGYGAPPPRRRSTFERPHVDSRRSDRQRRPPPRRPAYTEPSDDTDLDVLVRREQRRRRRRRRRSPTSPPPPPRRRSTYLRPERVVVRERPREVGRRERETVVIREGSRRRVVERDRSRDRGGAADRHRVSKRLRYVAGKWVSTSASSNDDDEDDEDDKDDEDDDDDDDDPRSAGARLLAKASRSRRRVARGGSDAGFPPPPPPRLDAELAEERARRARVEEVQRTMIRELEAERLIEEARNAGEEDKVRELEARRALDRELDAERQRARDREARERAEAEAKERAERGLKALQEVRERRAREQKERIEARVGKKRAEAEAYQRGVASVPLTQDTLLRRQRSRARMSYQAGLGDGGGDEEIVVVEEEVGGPSRRLRGPTRERRLRDSDDEDEDGKSSSSSSYLDDDADVRREVRREVITIRQRDGSRSRSRSPVRIVREVSVHRRRSRSPRERRYYGSSSGSDDGVDIRVERQYRSPILIERREYDKGKAVALHHVSSGDSDLEVAVRRGHRETRERGGRYGSDSDSDSDSSGISDDDSRFDARAGRLDGEGDDDDDAAGERQFSRDVYKFFPSRLSRSDSVTTAGMSNAETLVSGGADGGGGGPNNGGAAAAAAGGNGGANGPGGPKKPGMGPPHDTEFAGPGGPGSGGAWNLLNVFESSYVGDAMLDGSHSAKLTVVHDFKRQRQPLFRWLHVRQAAMSFDDLSMEIKKLQGLTDLEAHGLSKLLDEVKRTCVKTKQTARGTNVKYMEPRLVQVAIPQEAGSSRDANAAADRPVSWMAVPFFSLEKYSGLLSAASTTSYPTQTLLQAQYSRYAEDRDMLQAVCQSPNVPDGFCFHIAQVWCIVLDNSLLVTYGAMLAAELRNDVVRLLAEPPPQRENGGRAAAARIYVSYSDCVLWAFPLDECATWFDFTAHFRDWWPRPIQFTLHGRPVTEKNWEQTVYRAQHSHTRVTIAFSTGSSPQPPPPGLLIPLVGAKKKPEEPAPGLMAAAVAAAGLGAAAAAAAAQPATDSAAAAPTEGTPPSDQTARDPGPSASSSTPPPPPPPPQPDAPKPRVSSEGGDDSEEEEDPDAAEKNEAAAQSERFHVFSWLTAGDSAAGAAGDESSDKALRDCLQAAEDILTGKAEKAHFGDVKAYNRARLATREEVYEFLKGEDELIKKSKRKHPVAKRMLELRIDLFNAADIVYRFFLPPNQEGPTVGKFWGAMKRLTRMPDYMRRRYGAVVSRRRSQRGATGEYTLTSLRTRLRALTRPIQAFKSILSHAAAADGRARVAVPDDLAQAWMHCVMGAVFCAHEFHRWQDQMAHCEGLIRSGMRAVFDDMGRDNALLNKTVVMPMEIVSLFSMRLLADVTNGLPNISDTYSEYLKTLDAEITTQSDRSYQHRISLLRQELAVIRSTLSSQRRLFAELRRLQAARVLATPQGRAAARVSSQEQARRMAQLEELERRTVAVRHAEHQHVQQQQRMHAASQAPFYGGGGGGGVSYPPPPQPIIIEKERSHHHSYYADPAAAQHRAQSQYPAYQQHYYPEDDLVALAMSPFGGGGGGLPGAMVPGGALAEFGKLSAKETGGFRELLWTELLAYLDRRQLEAREFGALCDALEEKNANKIDVAKDRQEQAIYAFTIVTIVFLPLSAVAGIFGMNTSDIRDMDQAQWLYWATAVPTTLLVIVLGLWWMGELGNAARWLLDRVVPRSLGGGGPGGGGGARRPAVAPAGAAAMKTYLQHAQSGGPLYAVAPPAAPVMLPAAYGPPRRTTFPPQPPGAAYYADGPSYPPPPLAVGYGPHVRRRTTSHFV